MSQEFLCAINLSIRTDRFNFVTISSMIFQFSEVTQVLCTLLLLHYMGLVTRTTCFQGHRRPRDHTGALELPCSTLGQRLANLSCSLRVLAESTDHMLHCFLFCWEALLTLSKLSTDTYVQLLVH